MCSCVRACSLALVSSTSLFSISRMTLSGSSRASAAAELVGGGTGTGLHTHKQCQANELNFRNGFDDRSNNESGWPSIVTCRIGEQKHWHRSAHSQTTCSIGLWAGQWCCAGQPKFWLHTQCQANELNCQNGVDEMKLPTVQTMRVNDWAAAEVFPSKRARALCLECSLRQT